MKTIIDGSDRFLLRFDPGEDVMVEFKKWAELWHGQSDLKAATFTMIGAASSVLLAYYDLHNKKYIDTPLNEDVEIISVMGNLSWKKDDAGKFGIIVHAHGVFSGPQAQVWGGHVKQLIVSVTCEVSLVLMNGKGEAIREFDERCGLALLK